jgi:hypothetical protein
VRAVAQAQSANALCPSSDDGLEREFNFLSASQEAQCARCVHREIKENLETANVSSPELNATFPLAEVPRAHAMLDANEQIGKVVLTVDPELAGVIPHLRAA